MNSDPDDLTIRWLDTAGLVEYRGLFRETFGLYPDCEYFLWKYLGHPHSFTATSVAYQEGQLIGALGAIPKLFKVNEDSVIGTHELDMMVRKEARNKGVFFKLFKFRLNTPPEKELFLSVGMNDHVLRAFAERFLGYRDVDTVPQFIRILDASAFLRRRFERRLLRLFLELPLRFVLKGFDMLAFFCYTASGRKYEIRKIERFDIKYDDLWSRASSGIGIAVVRDSAYLNWRYADNPLCNNETWTAIDSSGRSVGFIVFTTVPETHETGVILELVIDPACPGVTVTLLRKALSVMKGEGVVTAAFWAFQHQRAVRALRKMGFRKKEQNLFLQVRNLSEKLDWDELTDGKKWYISMGDNDFYYGCPI